MNKREVKKIMENVKRKEEKIVDIDIWDDMIWVLVSNEGILWNYTINTKSGDIYKALVARTHGDLYHWGNIEL